MSSLDEYIIKYHHGGELARDKEFTYLNGSINEFCVDPDKLCYWDMLGDVKELGYDINNTVNLTYVDDDRTLNNICNDQGIVGLVEQIMKHNTVDVYVEISGVGHGMILPEDPPMFKKMYICLAAVREGFLSGCRKLIGLDGCFLKGVVKGQILVAVGRDGNNQMYPIAWAVVDKETTESWSWFLKLLCADLQIRDGLGWSIISDMQKGLIHAVNDLFPLIEHRMCARHIYARWGKSHPGKELQMHFWSVARCSSEPEMKKQLERMKNLKGGAKAVEELLERWPISGWCQAFFSDLIKCDVIDNNMCETFNGVILESRSKPIITMLEDIRQYVMTRIAVKKQYAMKWKNACGPNIVARIEKERKKSSRWHVEWNGGASHEVFRDCLVQHVREGYVVLLACQSCSCGKWNKSGVPCEHALAVISFNGEDPVDFVAEWFKRETYLMAYNSTVNPVKGREFWPVSDAGPLQPPVVKKMPGRPVKKRRREPLEGKNGNKTKISRHGRVFKCTICHEEGHNRLRCPKRDNTVLGGNPQSEATPVQDGSIGSSRQRMQRRIPSAAQASLGKQKVRFGTQGPVNILRGAHHGGVIAGRENPQFASFITTRGLNALKSKMLLANQTNDGEQSEQTTIEDTNIPTQNSTTQGA